MKTALVLFGATAVGKTAAMEALIRDTPELRHKLEIVSADSRQIYRGADIGTAKPSGAERQLIPHHLIDVLDLSELFDVGRFVHACDALIPEIRARGRLPVITGGTAFYLKAFLYGLPETPPASMEIRDQLRERLKRNGIEALRQELITVDPISADRINSNDVYRILRALEVYHATGRPRSSFSEPRTVRAGMDVIVAGLRRDRESLYQRINRRVAEMFASGLPAEVEALYCRGYRPGDPGLHTIGYREFFTVGGAPPWSTETLSEVQHHIARNTRHYARRQDIFFRTLPGITWIDADDHDLLLRILLSALER